MSKNAEFVLSKRHEGENDLKNAWQLKDSEIPHATQDGEFVIKTLYLSVDPYLSSGLKKSALGGNVNEIGSVQQSIAVAEVIESKGKFPVGTILYGVMPWRKFNLVKDSEAKFRPMNQSDAAGNFLKEKGFAEALVTLGMPSQTAYYGCFDVGKFAESDVLVVSGAAGAVGSVVCQIAKNVIKCKKVIGIAGGKDKCELLKKEFGCDDAIDYKEVNTREKMAARLNEITKESGPISAYFDNTGGFTTDAVFDVIGRKGRVIVCGQISAYNKDVSEEYTFPNYLAKIIYKAVTIQGYVVGDFFAKNESEFYPSISKWASEGKLNVKTTLVEGFEKTPEAYEMLYKGGNIGKIVVKVA